MFLALVPEYFVICRFLESIKHDPNNLYIEYHAVISSYLLAVYVIIDILSSFWNTQAVFVATDIRGALAMVGPSVLHPENI